MITLEHGNTGVNFGHCVLVFFNDEQGWAAPGTLFTTGPAE